ncbi:MAG: alpha-ketoacid dehydrogenase subunit beta [Gammaproteobacteria bacterium]|nr:alpha-ketoacid dehydrogenase subunit beta [Gammaproteobacteria bacterium]
MLSFAEALHEAFDLALAMDDRVFIMGEGVPDPRAIFATTAGLAEKYGADRVRDMPLAENGMTGICIGAALMGERPILIHQRLDFALLSCDQLINNGAKWHYMFNGAASVPLVIRLIVGRGWGQGPQHSQSLHALFAHIPGLKVVMPATAYEAKGMMLAAIADNNPVIFIEHRWLHPLQDQVPSAYYTVSLEGGALLQRGEGVTVVAFSYMVIEALRAARALEEVGIQIEVVNMRGVSPLRAEVVLQSVKRTGRLIVADIGATSFGVAAELVATVAEHCFDSLLAPPQRVANPDYPLPTSPAAAAGYYPGAVDIATRVLTLLGQESRIEQMQQRLQREGPEDVPQSDFHGPF